MPSCVKIQNHANLLKKVKDKTGLTWIELSQKLDIHPRTIYYYLKNSKSISFYVFKKLCSLANINYKKFKYTLINHPNEEKTIFFPKLNKKLSEILGALAGDGHLHLKPYEFSLVGDGILDYPYLNHHISPLLIDQFKTKPTLSQLPNKALKLRIYSKKLVFFINTHYFHPIGKKKNKLHIPPCILSNYSFLKCYIRGLFDTDGSFYGRRKNEPVIEIISKDDTHILEIQHALSQLDFSFGRSGKNLSLYNKHQIHNFFKEIRPHNLKHLIKYHLYQATGKIIKTQELRNIMHR